MTVKSGAMAFVRGSSVLTVIAEVTLWLLMSVLTLLLAYNLIGVEPYRRGFFCDDEAIRYPYKEDTVSDTLVTVIFIVVPIFIMIIIETVHILSSKERKAKGTKSLIQKIAVKYYRTIGAFLLATLCTMFLTETTKLIAGRLRPHFISLCKPDFAKLNCSAGYITVNDDTCTSGVTINKLLDARKSFPSGHASLAAFGAIYLQVFLQLRFIWTQKIRVILPLVQTGILCASIFVCVSRVNDNKHHFSDVIAGAALGTMVALLSIKYVSCVRRTKGHASYCMSEYHQERSGVPVHINVPARQTGIHISTVLENVPARQTGIHTSTVLEMKDI